MAQKQTVIDRLRAAESWLARLPGHGAEPFTWMLALVHDARQELQSEAGELWLQTPVAPGKHIRLFVEGAMGVNELDLLIEMLTMQRKWRQRDEEAARESPQSDDAVARGSEASTV